MKHLLILLTFVAITSCTVMRPAVNAVDSVCSDDLLDHSAVIELAEAKGWPAKKTAEWLCGFPPVFDAWQAALNRRSDPAEAAVKAARKEGLL